MGCALVTRTTARSHRKEHFIRVLNYKPMHVSHIFAYVNFIFVTTSYCQQLNYTYTVKYNLPV